MRLWEAVSCLSQRKWCMAFLLIFACSGLACRCSCCIKNIIFWTSEAIQNREVILWHFSTSLQTVLTSWPLQTEPLAELDLPKESQPSLSLFLSSAHNVFLAIATFSILSSGLSTTTTLQMSYLEHMCTSFCHLLGKSLLLHFPTASTSAIASKWANLSQSA